MSAIPTIDLCTFVLIRGKRKGLPCGSKTCKKHMASIPIHVCQYMITRGKKKGTTCGVHNCKKHIVSDRPIQLCTYVITRGSQKGKTCGANNCKKHSIKEQTVTRTEVQAHGLTIEKELCVNVYGATNEELRKIKYTSKVDLPAEFNRLDKCDLSVKTSGKNNQVCMSDCLRMYDEVGSDNPLHMVVVHYEQDDATHSKHITRITEIDLTHSRELLFGTLTRSQIEELDKSVKAVPQKRKPTKDEYDKMYSIRNKLQESSGAIHLDIKCNSTQSRLQCSFNRFQHFIETHPEKIIATSHTNAFRGGVISPDIISSRRVFKSK